MRARGSIVHGVRGNDLILYSKMVERHDVLGTAALKLVKVFNSEYVFDQLELEARRILDLALQVALI